MTGNCSASQRVLANSLRVVSAKRGNSPLGGLSKKRLSSGRGGQQEDFHLNGIEVDSI